MSTTDVGGIRGIDLSGDQYTVVQSAVREKYRAEDADGNVVLRGKQKMLKLKEKFPFVDADGNEVFTVTAQGISDVAGNYTLTDAQTGEAVLVLDNDYSLFQDTWKLRDATTDRAVAEINSRGAMRTLARQTLPLGSVLFPHRYEITDADDDHVGEITGQLSLTDTYDVRIDDASSVPKEAIVAAAMVIDAIEQH
jgi:uncharacterized protein YxjI